jgi:hypothetical protein
MLTQTFLAEADGEGGVNGAAPAQPLSSLSLHQPFSAVSVAGAGARYLHIVALRQAAILYVCTHARTHVRRYVYSTVSKALQ